MLRFPTAFLLGVTLVIGVAQAADRKPPYWASIKAGEARMRKGPGTNYPIEWMYKRADLPIRVVETFPNWRKVQDPDGAVGWMQLSLVQATRTAIVSPGAIRELRENPTPMSQVTYRIQPGVVGRVSKCGRGWCRLAVGNRTGFIRTSDIWGVDPNEAID